MERPQTQKAERRVPAQKQGDAEAIAHDPKEPRCEARGLEKSFGSTHVLRGVDLVVPEGGFAVLVGSSGCGKSTLLRSLAGLETIDAGTIRLAGRDVTTRPPRERDV